MPERKYSVAEIDRMRAAVRCMVEEWHSDRAGITEDRLRTYMLNGTDPDELESAAEAHWELEERRREANMIHLDARGYPVTA